MGVELSANLERRIGAIRGYVIDMDGVLYRGDTVLPHVNEFLGLLDQRGIPFIMATNNSMRTPEQYVTKLASMGITIRPDQVLTSGLATKAWLKERYPSGTRAYVVGMPALHEAICGDGYFVYDEQDPQVVVSGADFTLTYEKLKVATLAIRRGAAYVATNADTTFPTEVGLIPGSGAIVAAIRAATDVDPDVIGKPAPGMVVEGAEIIGTGAEDTAVLGDRLDTDILAGARAGFTTILVLTGVSSHEDLTMSEIVPDIVIPDLAPVVGWYRAH